MCVKFGVKRKYSPTITHTVPLRRGVKIQKPEDNLAVVEGPPPALPVKRKYEKQQPEKFSCFDYFVVSDLLYFLAFKLLLFLLIHI